MNHTAKSLVDGYRALADFIEAHADDLKWPESGESLILYTEEDTAENVSRVAHLLTPATKTFTGNMFALTHSCSESVQLKVYFYRSAVCTKRVIGTKHIEAHLIEAYDEEIVEWDCGPILEGTEAEPADKETP